MGRKLPERGRYIFVNIKGQTQTFVLMALDYRECDDPMIRNLQIQRYFKSRNEIELFIANCGFEIEAYKPFHFASPVNPDNEIDVYTLRKSK